MARRSNGSGTYIHIVPTKCSDCKEFNTCTVRTQVNGKCRKRDCSDHWVYQYYVKGIDGTTRRAALEARTRRLLEQKVEKMLMDAGAVAAESVTVGQWCDVWIEKVLVNTVKKSTLDYYKNMIKYTERIRNKRLSKLTALDLQSLFAELLVSGGRDGKPLSSTTVRSFRSTMKSCLSAAVEHGYASVNVANKTKPPLHKKKEMSYLSYGG